MFYKFGTHFTQRNSHTSFTMDMVHTCTSCNRNFDTLRGLNVHCAHCKVKKVIIRNCNQVTASEEVIINVNERVETSAIVDSGEINILVENNIEPNLPSFEPTKNFPVSALNGLCGAEFAESIHSIYEEIIQWRKNLFKLPTGKAAKTFIRVLTVWLEHFNRQTEHHAIALKVYMVLPSLLLQKPSQNSKAKDHCRKLEERLSLWKEGQMLDLLKEGRLIQERLKSSKS